MLDYPSFYYIFNNCFFVTSVSYGFIYLSNRLKPVLIRVWNLKV